VTRQGMSTSTAISVERLSKSYRLGMIGGGTLQGDLSRWWAKVRHLPDPSLRIGSDHHARQVGDEFWAINDVSFDVVEGEVLGIVGRNGAGKSTLLKILSQVTAPTSGRITLRGRVASLLEVGTGFHPELTGRENVFLNGAIMGMTKAEIRRKFDEIVAFSECETFIDTPVKRYSSGMYVRLAFAVAAHLEPEILIVDEVLAVGDAQFQKKCLGKMGEASRGGRTVLFVSHNMVAVQSLCHRAVLLADGRVEFEGSAASVVGEYLRDTHAQSDASEWTTPEDAPGNDMIRLKRLSVAATQERADGLIAMTTPITVETEFWVVKPDQHLHLTYVLVNEQGIIVLTTASSSLQRAVGLYRATFTLPGNLLNSGDYSLRLLIIQNGTRPTYDQDALARFSVVDLEERGHASTGREPGVVQPPLPWSETRLGAPYAVPDAVPVGAD
jgi:lipopolysaccharide transport system ATP-binding protein